MGRHPKFLGIYYKINLALLLLYAKRNSKLQSVRLRKIKILQILFSPYQKTLNSIAVCSRTELKKNFETNTIDKNYTSDFQFGTTSGSTGEPLRFYRSHLGGGSIFLLKKYLHSRLWRSLLWDKQNIKNISTAQFDYDMVQKVKMPTNTHTFLPPNLLYNQDQEVITRHLLKHNISIISFSASFVYDYCRYLRSQNKNRPALSYIFLHGEYISNEKKNFIQETFPKAIICDRYGLEETFWSIACSQKNHEPMTPYYESCIIEILSESGLPCAEKEIGRVVITDLCNYTFPLIRYETGDLAQVTQRQGIYISFNLIGRNQTLYFGSLPIAHHTINEIFGKFTDLISQYQIAKISEDEMEIRIVPANEIPDIQTIEFVINRYIPDYIKKTIVFVPFLKKTKGSSKNVILKDES